jgi:hypothetical protein
MYEVLLKQIRYGAFLGICGGIASFVGEPHGGLIKAMIGVVIGAAILGKRLPRAIAEYYEHVKQVNEEISKTHGDDSSI